MNFSISVCKGNMTITLNVQSGTLLGPLLRSEGMLTLPCGAGRCGKCLVQVDPPTPPCSEEQHLLDEKTLAAGLRLACCTRVRANMTVTIPTEVSLRVLLQFAQADYVRKPLLRQCPLTLSAADLHDQRSDLQRLMMACGATSEALTQEQLADVPLFVRLSARKTAHLIGNELVGFGKNETLHAVVLDIGTTTVASLLVEMEQGRVLASLGERNAQAPFGADVISRIQQQTEWRATHHGNADPLRMVIVRQLDAMLTSLLDKAGLDHADCIAIAGNTSMMHLLCGLPTQHIAMAPFVPVTLGARRLPARALGLAADAPVFLLPGISAYVGADIVASLLAADAHHGQLPFLLVDLGTNAEIVLGVNDTLYACSAAAGPCFEGATLSCGMAGQDGAIDTVTADPVVGLTFTTLGQQPPKGVCGSGILDAVAVLLDAGLLDETGCLHADDTPLGRRVMDDALEFIPGIRLTQRDIREIQLAKAAVRAGVEILLQQAGLSVKSIACLYLAGGFGSSLAPRSAARIGLIPTELAGRSKPLGNAACFGALRYIMEDNAVENAASLVQRTRYIELSAHPSFSDFYIDHICFPEV